MNVENAQLAEQPPVQTQIPETETPQIETVHDEQPKHGMEHLAIPPEEQRAQEEQQRAQAGEAEDVTPQREEIPTPPLPTPPKQEVSPEIAARLHRLEEFERSEMAREALAYEQQQRQLIQQQQAAEQYETRLLAQEMERLGNQATALAEAGRIEEAEQLKVHALSIFNEYNQKKAVDRIVAQAQAVDQQKAAEAREFKRHVADFQTQEGWKDFCDPNDPQKSERIAAWATDLKLRRGYKDIEVWQLLNDLHGREPGQRTQQAQAAVSQAQVQAGMETPSGRQPVSSKKKHDSEDTAIDNVLGLWFGRRPKT